MKLSDGFRNPLPSVAIFVFYALSIVSLTLAVRTLDISIAYAIWAALGTVLIAAIGFFYFGETMNTARIFFIVCILFGVMGLRLTSH